MVYFLIFSVSFADMPPISAKFLVVGGADVCMSIASHMLKDPPPTVQGHVPLGWTVGCFAQKTSTPTNFILPE